MDRKSWPWKKKSSDKKAAAIASNCFADVSDTSTAPVDQAKQDKPKCVQISMESYVHLTGLEDQVMSYEEQVRDLEDKVNEVNEKLSEANSEMNNKDNLVKQHAKVAEEAVSGWEKAEAEAAALKNHLESVTFLKLTAEDRASHLDGALKECMRQIRDLKDEHDRELNEVVLNKTKLFDKMKQELEANIANLEQELLRSAAENATLSRSLQERSNMLIQMSGEKSQADAEIERLKGNIGSCEKEINSLRYEVHIAKKEVEIRSEEKNMSMRSAEVANKQHLEAVKKITRLESECQRLRGLVRKRLPGPAALAQMKLEVESFGRDYGEPRVRSSPVKSPSLSSSQLPEFSFDETQKYVKESELLTERLQSMEEETKMLKEALAKCNSELQDSRNFCVQAVSKLQILETQLQVRSNNRSPHKSYVMAGTDGLRGKVSNASCCTFISMSEDGNDDIASGTGSWSTGLMSELSQIKKEKNADSAKKWENSNLYLMDDFLEMEKLAYQSDKSNGTVPGNKDNPTFGENEASVESTFNTKHPSGDQHALGPQVSPKEDVAVATPQLHSEADVFGRLQLNLSRVLDSICSGEDKEKLLEDIRGVMQEALHHHSVNSFVKISHRSGTTNDPNTYADGTEITATREISLSGDDNTCLNNVQTINQEMEAALSQIYNFMLILGKEAKSVLGESPDGDGLIKNLCIFSKKYSNSINNEIDLVDFILSVAHVLTKASELHFSVLGFKNSVVETSNSDYIDKIVLPENKDIVDTLGKKYPNGCSHSPDSASDPQVPTERNLFPTSEKTTSPWNCTLEEFEELKRDKDTLAGNLVRCTENFESTQAQLSEREQLLIEVKSELASAQKSNSLAETQLRCMAESYKSLESREEKLQTEVNVLKGKIENLQKELQEERKSHQNVINRCRDLQEKLDRTESCAPADNDCKTNQELAAAAEKLAECQETIYVLGKQLKALRPQTDIASSPDIRRSRRLEAFLEDGLIVREMNLHNTDPSEPSPSTPSHSQRIVLESSSVALQPTFSPSDSETDLPRSPTGSRHHHPSKSASSSVSSTPTPEKHARGFSRFFSSKAKYEY